MVEVGVGLDVTPTRSGGGGAETEELVWLVRGWSPGNVDIKGDGAH